MILTYGAKVFVQNICSFFSHIKATGGSQKQLISKTQHFLLFPNMGSEILYRFLFQSNEGIFQRPKKLVSTKMLIVHTQYSDPKLNVETFVDISACRVNFALQNVLFDFLFVFQEST